MSKKSPENHDSGPQTDQGSRNCFSETHWNTPTPPLSGHGLESCPRGGREGTLSQVGWKLLPLWGGRRGLEEVRALARKISGQRERGQGQSQKQGPRQHQENQGQPGKDRGQA